MGGWTIIVVVMIVLLVSSRFKWSRRGPSTTPPPSNDEDLNNPLDVHLTGHVTQTQLAGKETIQVSLPGEEKSVAVKLKPDMRGKVVRLPNAVGLKAGHVFLHLQVLDTPTYSTPESSHETTEKISLYGYEISRKDWSLWVHMCNGDDNRARRLCKSEHEQFLSRGFFYNSEQDPVHAAMQRYRDDQSSRL